MKSLFYFLNGTTSVVIYFINTVFWFIPLMAFSLLKLLPIARWQRWMSIIVDSCATNWISVNKLNQNVFSRTKFVVNIPSNFSLDAWYLVIANHQSWVDILVLQRVFNHRIPFLKFFLKKNLIFVPFLGLAWWGLDFPFMQRYSKATLAKHPELRGKDLETTKKACEKYESKPVSIMNFVEGTRFSPQKNASKIAQNLQLTHTLAPKSGGIAFVLNAMGDRLTQLVDVTIYYPKGIPSYWDFISGKVKQIVVDVKTTDINEIMNKDIYHNDYFTDEAQKRKFQQYLNQLWQQKNQKLIELEQEYTQR
jgi:1-acyl-sn-glycerol-3-phosphate acyltransferase